MKAEDTQVGTPIKSIQLNHFLMAFENLPSISRVPLGLIMSGLTNTTSNDFLPTFFATKSSISYVVEKSLIFTLYLSSNMTVFTITSRLSWFIPFTDSSLNSGCVTVLCPTLNSTPNIFFSANHPSSYFLLFSGLLGICNYTTGGYSINSREFNQLWCQ